MKKLIFSFAVLLSCIGAISQSKFADATSAEQKEAEVIEENTEKSIKKVDNIIKDALKSPNASDKHYTVDSKEEFKERLEEIDISSESYEKNLTHLYENTAPDVIADEICEQSADAVQAMDEIGDKKPDESLNYTAKDGTECMKDIYYLDSGAMIILSGEDAQDNTYEKEGNDFFSPCSIVTQKWYNDKGIMKKKGARRYTTKCQIGVGKTVKGHISVTNHYTVTDAGIKFREARVWDYSASSPLKVTENGKAKLTSSSYCKKPGQTLSVMADFKISCNVSKNVSISGEVAGISVGTTSTWNGNYAQNCKLFAKVELRVISINEVMVDQYGVLQHSKLGGN